MAALLRDFLMTRSENPVDLLNAATRLFGGSITTSPLVGLGSGDHELRGVAAHDFAVGFFASPLDVRVAAAPGGARISSTSVCPVRSRHPAAP